MSAPSANRTLGELADEHGRTDRLNDPAPTFEPVCEDTDTKGNSTCLTLQSCPSCPVKFDDERDLRLHLELHGPEHFAFDDEYVPFDPLTPDEIPGGDGE